MARTAKITNANVGPLKNVRGAVGNTPVRAQDFNTLIGDHVSQSDASAQSIAGTLTVTGGVQSSAVARTATSDGLTTGIIAAGTSVVTLTSGNAAHIVALPAPVIGNIIYIIETGTTGYELRSSAPATIGINGGTASGGESAVAGAITYIKCVCVSATNWVCSQYDADGDESKVEAAA